MLRTIVIAVCVFVSVGVFSQQSDFFLLGKLGYHYGDPGDRIALGADVRVGLTDPLKISSGFTFGFPHGGVTGLDVNVNALYSIPVGETPLEVYPLAGLNMDNNRYNKDGFKRSWTKWGVNLGAGLDYYIATYDFINIDIQYTFVRGYAKAMIGYGHRF